MRSIWQSLAWKEWHEHKWKLAALTAIVFGVVAIVNLSIDEVACSLTILLTYTTVPLSIFLGAGDAAGERGRGTLPFLQSLPIPVWKSACWKTVFGLFSCVVPAIFALLLIGMLYWLLPARGAELTNELHQSKGEFPIIVNFGHIVATWSVSAGLLAALAGASIYLWTVAVGVNRKDEVRAGAMALAIVIGCWTVLWILAATIGEASLLLWGGSPGGPSMLLAITAGDSRAVVNVPYTWAVAAAVAAHAMLFLWFIVNFGCNQFDDTKMVRSSSAGVPNAGWVGPPRGSALTAIVWKQVRESGPIAVAGLAAILFFLCVNLVASPDYYLGDHKYLIAELHASLTMEIGLLVVLIVGIGVFDRDLSPKLHTFWRSRPINPNLWYWTKYLTGLVVLVVAMGAPVLISGTWYLLTTGWWQWFPARHSPHLHLLAMMISILVAVYALALTTICLVRVTIYAAILSVGTLAGGMSLAWYFVGEESVQWTMSDWATTIAAMTSVVAVLVSLLGWWAVRHDIGWKNR